MKLLGNSSFFAIILKMIRSLHLLLLAPYILAGTLLAKPLKVSVEAESAILINADTMNVLFEKKAKQKQYPASITKIATAAYALKVKGNQWNPLIAAEHESVASISPQAKRQSNYTMPSHWIEAGSTHIGIKRGEEFAFQDLLRGMMIASGNDAANVIALHVGGSMAAFMEGMNHYIKSLGCHNTHFTNAHGLHHPKHETTAYDMAIITVEALKNPLFSEIVKTVNYKRPKTNKQEPVPLVQGNKLLRKGEFHYPKAIGVKIGGTSIAHGTFVAAAKDGDRTLVAVLLNVKEKGGIFRDAKKLFEAAFNESKIERNLIKAGRQSYALTLEGAEKPIPTTAQENMKIAYYPAEEPVIKAYLVWDDIKLPVKKGQRVGEIQLKSDRDEIFKKVTLFADEDVGKSWGFTLKSFFGF